MAWGARGGGGGVDDLVARLSANDATLRSLTLFRGRRFGGAEVAALAAALRGNSTLTELYASSHAMAPAAAAALADALRDHASLTSLCVGDADFGDEGVEALAPGVARLLRLDVECKRVGVRGAAALAAALAAAALARGGASALSLPPLQNPLVPRPPAAPPPLSVQQADAAAYAEWTKKDQYRYSSVPLRVNPRYGTDMASGADGTTFYSNMPVTWLVTQVAGGRDARFTVATQTANHLQLLGAGRAGVWRVTAAAVACLDTCAPNCGADTCTAQLGAAACTAVAAGIARPGKDCNLAYTVAHFRVITRWQVVIAVILFLAGFLACYALINGLEGGLPGLWQSADGTSWTVKAPAVPTGLAPPALAPRAGMQRLRLDIEEGAARAVPKMFRSAADQEKAALL